MEVVVPQPFLLLELRPVDVDVDVPEVSVEALGSGEAEALVVIGEVFFDRFSRSRLDALKYKAILKKYGVKLVSATEAISDGPEGILLESVLDGLAEYYSADLSEKVVRGMTENVINGKVIGGMRTFGYRTVDHRYVVDEKEAEIVRKIFNLYTKTTMTCNGIKKKFDELNIVKPNGKKFSSVGIYNIVKNERYTGVLRFRDHVNTEAIPRIIDDETFNLARAKLKDNSKHLGTFGAINPYLLYGKCICGYCNSMVRGYGGHSGTKHRYYTYYRCKNAVREKKCKGRSISKEFLEGIVAEVIREFLGDDHGLEELSKVLYENQLQESPYRISLEKEREESRKKMENIMLAIEQGAPFADFNACYRELQDKVAKIDHDLDKDKAKNPIFEKEEILATFKALRKIGTLTDEGKAILYRTFVNQVIVFRDRIEVVLNYKHSKKANSADILCPKGKAYATDAQPTNLYSKLHAVGQYVILTVELKKDSVKQWSKKG